MPRDLRRVAVLVMAAVAVAAAAAYAALVRPVLLATVDRWIGWEHGVVTLLALVLVVAARAAWKRAPAASADTAPRPGARHAQRRDARADDAFRDAAREYDAFVRTGRGRDRVRRRVQDALVATGMDADEARASVEHGLPAEHGLALPQRGRAERENALRRLLDHHAAPRRPGAPLAPDPLHSPARNGGTSR